MRRRGMLVQDDRVGERARGHQVATAVRELQARGNQGVGSLLRDGQASLGPRQAVALQRLAGNAGTAEVLQRAPKRLAAARPAATLRLDGLPPLPLAGVSWGPSVSASKASEGRDGPAQPSPKRLSVSLAPVVDSSSLWKWQDDMRSNHKSSRNDAKSGAIEYTVRRKRSEVTIGYAYLDEVLILYLSSPASTVRVEFGLSSLRIEGEVPGFATTPLRLGLE